jgi:TPR repeat protein
VAKDLARAKALLEKACNGGNAPACNTLGQLVLGSGP